MSSIAWLQLLSYLAFLIFAILFIAKTVRLATMPIHLRWELYPVAHEVGHKSGGSYLEDLDWWAKPQRKNLFGEIKYMMREGFLFEKCYRNNRGLWYFTYPFHMGLLLLIVWLALLFIGALTMLAGMPIAETANAWAGIVYYLTLGVGIAGIVLSTFGCVGLLIKRAVDKSLRLYTAPVDYLNLSFILAILLSELSSWCFFDPAFNNVRGFTRGLLTFSPVANVDPAMTTGIVLFSIFLQG